MAIMKRIAALSAVIIGLLAIPTAALASTTSTTSPRSAQPRCTVVLQRVHHHPHPYIKARRHLRGHRTLVCPFPRQVPLPQHCPLPQYFPARTVTFGVAAGSSVMTEVSGPQLSPTEEFVYDGTTYTVMTVNPGAGQFTAFANNHLFTSPAAITRARGTLIC